MEQCPSYSEKVADLFRARGGGGTVSEAYQRRNIILTSKAVFNLL